MTRKLKILLCLGQASAPVGNSTSWRDSILSALNALGYEIHLIDFTEFLSSEHASRFSKRQDALTSHILKEYEENKPFDYFLGFLADTHVWPELYMELNKNTYTINWTCNAHEFNLLHKKNSPFINLNTYISQDHKALYDSVNANSYWLPMGANTNPYISKEKRDIDISFVGTAYGRRPYYLWRLLQSGVDINLYGPGWKFKNNIQNLLRLYAAPAVYSFIKKGLRLNNFDKVQTSLIKKEINKLANVGDVPNDIQYLKILARSQISLNFPESRVNNDYMNPNVVLGCNYRDFEIPQSGSMLLTQNSDELEYFYKRDKEVVSFNNEYEMIDKARYYTKNLDEAKNIAHAGMLRAQREHTWEKRFEQLFSYIEKKK